MRIVKELLNRQLAKLGLAVLELDSLAGQSTVAAIQVFQRRVVKLHAVNGRVDPGSATFSALLDSDGPARSNIASKLSGSAWWHANEGKYPNSNSVSDLNVSFRPKVQAFIAALNEAGASVSIASTLRNKTRAYLMHYAWRIAKGSIAPANAPTEQGVGIVWDHGDATKSKAGAQEMVTLFKIKFQPSLTSLHLSGFAIDMDIAWNGVLKIKEKSGKVVPIGEPHDGASNTKLHAVGASYGVLKLLSDPPHWSSTGH
ncbi:MAG: peptidoglycan-binding protein [Pseudomonadota bacterium]|nr:peptidoglycan-binding protein [Pseudomonadota bacterium]